jgi:hypothetical protein
MLTPSGPVCSDCAVQIRVGKWVDRLQKQFYGTSFAYDKAIRVEVRLGCHKGVLLRQPTAAALVGAVTKDAGDWPIHQSATHVQALSMR